MVTASVISGSGPKPVLPTSIVCTPEPGMLKLMVSGPELDSHRRLLLAARFLRPWHQMHHPPSSRQRAAGLDFHCTDINVSTDRQWTMATALIDGGSDAVFARIDCRAAGKRQVGKC